jgi:BolA protein
MSGPGSAATRIERVLTERFRPAHLEVRDDSAAHAGHASAGGKGHFRVRIVSLSFSGLKPLQRHRLVNEALAALFETEVHAVAMETLTPEEYIS